MKKIFFTVVAFLCVSCGAAHDDIYDDVFSANSSPYLLSVSKKNFTLRVYNRKLDVLEEFRIGYGKNPDMKTKQQEGDSRTPEGVYKIDEILSMDADRSADTYRKLKRLNSLNLLASHGHSKYGKPAEDLGRNAYGPRFFSIDYPNKKDLERYKYNVKKGIIRPVNGKLPRPGSGLAVHGNNDEASIGHLCSGGCIRMFNRDIVVLDKYVRLGTPVVILKD